MHEELSKKVSKITVVHLGNMASKSEPELTGMAAVFQQLLPANSDGQQMPVGVHILAHAPTASSADPSTEWPTALAAKTPAGPLTGLSADLPAGQSAGPSAGLAAFFGALQNGEDGYDRSDIFDE